MRVWSQFSHHRLSGLGAGVVDVQAVVGLVLRECGPGFAVADLLPRVALPLVVGAVHLVQFGGGDLALQRFEQSTGADRGELRGVTDEHGLAVMLGR